MTDKIKKEIWSRAVAYGLISEDADLIESISKASLLISSVIKNGGKMLVFGNGGSAAEAQHFAAEFVCKFEKERDPLPAIALTTDTSILTAQSNDYGFENVFARQIKAIGKRGDLAIGLTTSDSDFDTGHSKNILNAFKTAKELELKSIGLFSTKTKYLLNFVDIPVIVPHHNPAIIQEVHLSIIHLLCRELDVSWS